MRWTQKQSTEGHSNLSGDPGTHEGVWSTLCICPVLTRVRCHQLRFKDNDCLKLQLKIRNKLGPDETFSHEDAGVVHDTAGTLGKDHRHRKGLESPSPCQPDLFMSASPVSSGGSLFEETSAVLQKELLPRRSPGGKGVKSEAIHEFEAGVKGGVSKAEDKDAKSSTPHQRLHVFNARDSGPATSTIEYIGRKIRSLSTHKRSCCVPCPASKSSFDQAGSIHSPDVLLADAANCTCSLRVGSRTKPSLSARLLKSYPRAGPPKKPFG
jgi:hypothetical protein